MQLLGPATVLIAFIALAAAATVMIREPRVGTHAERALWVTIIFFLPILGPVLYLSHRRRGGGDGSSSSA